MRLVDISISKRLWTAVTLPMLAAGYLAYVQISDRLVIYNDMQQITVASEQLKKLSDMVHALQVERGLTAGFIASKGNQNASQLASSRSQTDAAVGEFQTVSQELAKAVDFDLAGPKQSISSGIGEIAVLRRSVDSLSTTGAQSFSFYTGVVGKIVGLSGNIAATAQDAGIAQQMSGYVQLMQAKEIAGQERAIGNGFITAKRVDPSRFAEFAAMAGGQTALLNSSLSVLDENQRSKYQAKTLSRSARSFLPMAKMPSWAISTAANGSLFPPNVLKRSNRSKMRICTASRHWRRRMPMVLSAILL
ncbi:hypothetical protein HGO37_01805 [Rhizobium sp. CG4]|uniref:nitrate- and nitrite sensing domain-containing protein n=1 Tax=Rhizobium sp. CG4 TaxID=2726075 RepID=UPI002033A2A6|nr:nitrate- and nitrite sensing domain-containing protein [Rhizobium sp. CG4]MCM2454110.1 hypothetical protein [Rhizobium sp. CG4]